MAEEKEGSSKSGVSSIHDQLSAIKGWAIEAYQLLTSEDIKAASSLNRDELLVQLRQTPNTDVSKRKEIQAQLALIEKRKKAVDKVLSLLRDINRQGRRLEWRRTGIRSLQATYSNSAGHRNYDLVRNAVLRSRAGAIGSIRKIHHGKIDDAEEFLAIIIQEINRALEVLAQGLVTATETPSSELEDDLKHCLKEFYPKQFAVKVWGESFYRHFKELIMVVEPFAAEGIILNGGHYSFFNAPEEHFDRQELDNFFLRMKARDIDSEQLRKIKEDPTERDRFFKKYFHDSQKPIFDSYLNFQAAVDATHAALDEKSRKKVTREQIEAMLLQGKITGSTPLRQRRVLGFSWSEYRKPPEAALVSFIICAYLARKYHGNLAYYVEDFSLSNKGFFHQFFHPDYFPEAYQQIMEIFELPAKRISFYFESKLKESVFQHLFVDGKLNLQGMPGFRVSSLKSTGEYDVEGIYHQSILVAKYVLHGTKVSLRNFDPGCALLIGEFHSLLREKGPLITIFPHSEIMCMEFMSGRPGSSHAHPITIFTNTEESVTKRESGEAVCPL